MSEIKVKFIKAFLKILILFVAILIVLEFFLSNYFIERLSVKIENDRKIELVKSWEHFYDQKKQEFSSIVHGYAWWDELSQAFVKHEDSLIVESFSGDRFLTDRYDLLMAVNEKNSFIYGIYKGSIIQADQPEGKNLLDQALQYDFYKISSRNFDSIYSKDSIAELSKNSKIDTDIKSYWYCFDYVKGEPMAITVSSVCNNWGYPVTRGYLVFGMSLKSIISDAEKIIPAKITYATNPFKYAFSQTSLKSECADVVFYLSIDPYYKVYPVLKEAMFFFILMQVCFVTLLFSVALPFFTRRQTRYLKQIIEERTQTISNVNDELTKTNEELLSALANVKKLSGFLPICSSCKKIRNDQGYWDQVESFIQENSDVVFSHSLCPNCVEKLYPEIAHKINIKKNK